MQIPVKTLASGFSVPVLGYGTWHLGGGIRQDLENNDDADVAAIQRALDAGMTHIDTAELYASGHAEALVGRAIKGRDRSTLQIASKAWSSHFTEKDLRRSCEASLAQLGIDYLDLYLLHRFNPHVPLQETIATMDRLVDEGLVKHIGVSNFTTAHLDEARRLAKHPIVCNQVHYNLIFREPERDGLLAYCQQNNVMLVAWRPVQYGTFAQDVPPLLQEISGAHDKTPSQTAINWLISQPNVVTIFQTRNPDHLNENLGSVGWTLTPEEIERLRTEFPGQQDRSDAVPLG